ncbi:MAG: alpha/beta fold hydrolase [Polyangiaceae bacterium]|nr:alpha/beta fold hydrolase [Polyangiaceae bacterium]
MSAACADVEEPSDDDDSYVTTGVNGSTSSGETGGTASTGAWGHNGSGGEGGGSSSHGPYPIVLAHGFFGFEEFAGVEFATYFYQVKQYLADNGETQIFTPAVDPFNDSATRGAQLEAHIESILAETGADKVVVIGHSQGGLDARVVAHDRPELIAAVLTVATPHGGSPVSDIALGITENDAASDIIDNLVNLIGSAIYDEVGDETSVTDALYQFSTPGIAEFNATYPDAPGIFYASMTGRTDYHLGGQACVPDFHLAYIDSLKTVEDPTEALFVISEAIIDGSDDSPNDGLVRVEDAKHGEFWGCVPADHTDEIGQIFGDNPGFGNSFDHKQLFLELVRELRRRGF